MTPMIRELMEGEQTLAAGAAALHASASIHAISAQGARQDTRSMAPAVRASSLLAAARSWGNVVFSSLGTIATTGSHA